MAIEKALDTASGESNPSQDVDAAIAAGRIRRPQAVGLAVTAGLMSVSGVLLILFRYVLASDDPFSSYPHRLWPWVARVHVFVAPALFFFIGSIWWHHVMQHWRGQSRRVSGVVLIGVGFVTGVSGYLLFFTGSEFWLPLWRVVHAAGGAVATMVYIAHMILGLRMLREATRKETE